MVENFGRLRYTVPMARRATLETIDDLLADLAPTETWEAFASRCGVSSRTIRAWRSGAGGKRPYRPTVAAVAAALGCGYARVLDAIRHSRAAVVQLRFVAPPRDG